MKRQTTKWKSGVLATIGGTALVLTAACGPNTPGPVDDVRSERGTNIEINVDRENEPIREDDPTPWEEPENPYGNQPVLDLSDVVLETLIGGIEVDVGDTLRVDSLHESYGSDGYTQITTTAPNVVDGAAMIIFNVSGGLNHRALVPGAAFTFNNGISDDVQALSIDAIGCAGPEDGMWEFDVPADEVDVTIEEGEEPGTQVLNYFATFYDYEGNKSSAEGSFTYNPSELW